MARRFAASEAVQIEGLNEFRVAIKAIGDRKLTKALSDLNFEASRSMAVATKLRMSGTGRWLDNRAAGTVQAQRRIDGGQVALGPITLPSGRQIPATGVEFGAHRNRRRLFKNTGGRATIVRDNEDIGRVRANVERQYVGSRGSVKRRSGEGQRVQVVRTMKGWNQFQDWKGNKAGAGYYLFPALRAMQGDIARDYQRGIDELYIRAFPNRFGQMAS